MVLLLATFVVAAAAPTEGPEGRLSGALAEAFRDTHDLPRLVSRQPRFTTGAQVVIEVDDSFDPHALGAVEGVIEATVPGLVQLRLPVGQLARLAALAGVRHVREPAFASPTSTTSEGHATVGTPAWNDAGWTGEGVRVAVVDVGFQGYAALTGSELPIEVTTDLERGAPDTSAHGVAVAEVLTDAAPGVALSLHSFATDVEFTEVLLSLLDTDVQVVNASIGFDNVWSADGSSGPSRAVDALAEAGVIVTVAAGNEALRYRTGELRAVGNGQVLLAGHAATLLRAPGGRARASLRWDEPFDAAALDLDLVVQNASDGSECGNSSAPQDGDDPPREAVDVSGCEETVVALIRAAPGIDPARITGWLYSPGGIEPVSVTGGLSLSLPGDAAGAFTVGAWLPEDGELAAYSSRGPTDDGRIKPDVVAPSDVSTVSWGPEAFEGSSAATPHAAALAALWVEAEGGAGSPEGFRSWAHGRASEGGSPGADPAWGWGALAAGEAPDPSCACGAGGNAAPPALAWLAAALYRRRSR